VKESLFPQISLPLTNSTNVDDIPDAVLANKASMSSAIWLGVDISGIQDDQIASLLGTSSGNFSKYRSGQYSFPPDKLIPLMELCGNKVPLRWLALKCGYDLTPMRSTLEEEVDDLRNRLAESEREKETIVRFLRETRSA